MNFIKVKDGKASREPVPENLPVSVEALADLSWLDSSLGLAGCVWWPEVQVGVDYDPTQKRPDGTETLVVDQKAQVVKSIINLRDLTDVEREEIATEEQAKITKLVDSISEAVGKRLSELSVFSYGHQQREAAAITYRNAGYKGETDEWISSFSESAGMTYTEAVDLVLTQAEGTRAAVKELETLRMKKYSVARCADYETAQVEYRKLFSAIHSVVIP